MNRLYRSPTDRVLTGIAGGLAELWDLDPALVRVVWALLVPVTGGLALLAYIVLAIVVPERPMTSPPAASMAAAEASGMSEAEVEATAGAQTEPLADVPPRVAATPAPGRARRGSPGLVLGIVLILAGAYLLLERWLPNFDPDRFWPLLLVGLGVVLLVMAAAGRRGAGS
jgi:phage shock protein C